jgi:hypothetical protein
MFFKRSSYQKIKNTDYLDKTTPLIDKQWKQSIERHVGQTTYYEFRNNDKDDTLILVDLSRIITENKMIWKNYSCKPWYYLDNVGTFDILNFGVEKYNKNTKKINTIYFYELVKSYTKPIMGYKLKFDNEKMKIWYEW